MGKTFPIKVGQEVFLEPTGNLVRRRSGDVQLQRGTIIKIARKYFYVDRGSGWGPDKFEVETFQNINSDCNSAWILWATEEAYCEAKELERRLECIRSYFRNRHRSEMVPSEVINGVYEMIKGEGEQ